MEKTKPEREARSYPLLRWLVGESGEVAALKGNHLLETTQGGTIGEQAFGARAALRRSLADAGEEEHPACKNQGEFTQVIAVRVALSAKKREGLEDFDRVAGETSQRL